MNGINDSGPNQFLQRRLNIADSPAPASTLAPEIMPIIDALPESQEAKYLRGERLCGVTLEQADVLGEYAVCTLSNPANSRALVMVDSVRVNFTTTTGLVKMYLEKVSLPTMGAVGTAVRDSRWGPLTGSNRTLAIAANGSTAVAPNIAWVPFDEIRWVTTDPSVTHPLSLVIEPGAMLVLYTNGTGQPLFVTLSWRERNAQPSELV